jgi:hypothetical protein
VKRTPLWFVAQPVAALIVPAPGPATWKSDTCSSTLDDDWPMSEALFG